MMFSLDNKVRESSELELCPSAVDSFELMVCTELILVSLMLPEEEDADE